MKKLVLTIAVCAFTFGLAQETPKKACCSDKEKKECHDKKEASSKDKKASKGKKACCSTKKAA